MNDLNAFTSFFSLTEFIAVFLVGIFAGSFFNVCIYRLPRKQDIVFERSKCPLCRKSLGWLDLLPVAGYLWRRGKCHYCGGRICPRYPLVELLSGFLFLWCYAEYNLSAQFFKAALLTSFLIVIAFIDIDHFLIFDKSLVWMGGSGILINLWVGYGQWADLLLAAVLGGGFLYLVALLTGGQMGLGDAKMVFVIGLWLGTKFTALALFLSFFLGAAAGVILIAIGYKKRKEPVPFAPSIAAGTFFSLLYQEEIISWYWTNFGVW